MTGDHVTIEEAAGMLKIDLADMRKMIATGKIRTLDIGPGQVRVRLTEILGMLPLGGDHASR